MNTIRPYLLVSLRHKLVNKLKKRSQTEHKEAQDVFSDEGVDSVEERIIETEFKAEINSKLNEAYQVLSSRQREALFLRYHHGLAYEDICDSMNINYQSVRNLISQALKKLNSEILKNN